MGNALRDRIAVVTGSGRGIGRAIVMLLAAEGAKVVVNDLGAAPKGGETGERPADEVVAEIRSLGGEAVANYDSVASIETAQRIVQTALDTYGRIDILVNNAGLYWTTPFTELTEQDWDTMMLVHVKGHFACTHAAVPRMVRQRHGRIINVSSGAALGTSGMGSVHYATAKAGVLGFTRTLAQEIREYGITVNAIMPMAKTRMGRLFVPRTNMPAEVLSTLQDPEDVAPIVGYLATDEAANITGATFAARLKGTIQLMSDPAPIDGIYKDGRWTVEELARVIPTTLAKKIPSAN